MEKKTATAMA